MTRDPRSALEQRVASELERSAPRPSADLLDRVQAAVRGTPQRSPLLGGSAPRLLAVGASLAVVAMAVALVAPRMLRPPIGDASSRPVASASLSPEPSGTIAPLAWAAPDRYFYVVSSTCGERSFIGTYGITVEHGNGVRYAARLGSPDLQGGIPAIEDLLAEADEARRLGADEVTIETDPADGHPTSIAIDYDAEAIDDEACYLISEFQPLVEATSTPAAATWSSVIIQAAEPPGDVLVLGGYAWADGAVLTGQLAGPLAEDAGGTRPIAWFTRNGTDWLPAEVQAFAPDLKAFDISTVFERGDRLLAFGTGEIRASELTAVLFESRDGGASWQIPNQGIPGAATIRDVTRFGSSWVAVGSDLTVAPPSRPVVWLSDDGYNWEATALEDAGGAPNGYLSAVTVVDDKLVAVGALGLAGEALPRARSLTSNDGTLWSVGDPVPVSSDASVAAINDLASVDGAYVAVGSEDGRAAAWWSRDGFGWQQTDIGPQLARAISAIAVVGDQVVAVGDGIDHAFAWRSSGGLAWGRAEALDADAAASVVLGTGSGVLVVGNTLSTSADGQQPIAWLDTEPATDR